MTVLSITTPPLARLIQKRGYQLDAIIQVMQRMMKESLVDGFEFQNLAEWDAFEPPRDKAQFEIRVKSWENCEKYTIAELAKILVEAKVPILSVHGNRDVGINLCSEKQSENQRGEQLIQGSLELAQQVGAKICVFHLWDTWKSNFDPERLQQIMEGIADSFPSIKASVENVPINIPNCTPFDVVKKFKWITLDLRWAAMYNELTKFESIKNQITNVHLRGRLEENQWAIHHSPFQFYDALNIIQNEWGYSGLLTLEPEGGLVHTHWEEFAKAVSGLRCDKRTT